MFVGCHCCVLFGGCVCRLLSVCRMLFGVRCSLAVVCRLLCGVLFVDVLFVLSRLSFAIVCVVVLLCVGVGGLSFVVGRCVLLFVGVCRGSLLSVVVRCCLLLCAVVCCLVVFRLLMCVVA